MPPEATCPNGCGIGSWGGPSLTHCGCDSVVEVSLIGPVRPIARNLRQRESKEPEGSERTLSHGEGRGAKTTDRIGNRRRCERSNWADGNEAGCTAAARLHDRRSLRDREVGDATCPQRPRRRRKCVLAARSNGGCLAVLEAREEALARQHLSSGEVCFLLEVSEKPALNERSGNRGGQLEWRPAGNSKSRPAEGATLHAGRD